MQRAPDSAGLLVSLPARHREYADRAARPRTAADRRELLVGAGEGHKSEVPGRRKEALSIQHSAFSKSAGTCGIAGSVRNHGRTATVATRSQAAEVGCEL